MILRNIRSTPLRLTIMLMAIFVMSSAASFTAAYLVIKSSFDTALADEIDLKFATYQTIENQSDLLERLLLDNRSANPELLILQYHPDEGAPIANVTRIPPSDGFSVVSEAAIDHSDQSIADSYLARSARVGQGRLTIAQTREQIVNMGEIMLSVVMIGLLPAFFAASVFGVFVAGRAKAKIGDIQKTLAAFTGGDMSARVPTGKESNDLSDIGHAVNKMAASQDALMVSMRQISTDIAHDLKTPIQRVAVLVDQIVERTNLSDEQARLLHQASAEVDRIDKTFQALLQLAQIEGGAVRDRFASTDLKQITTDMVEFLDAEVEDQGYVIGQQLLGAGPFTINGDRHLLSQVVANLIQNALRHTPKGSRIDVALTTTNSHVILSVADNGPGIPKGETDKVLRRLYRMEKSRTTQGNGLGLSLVAAICALHDAKLELLDNTPGLRVKITFNSAI